MQSTASSCNRLALLALSGLLFRPTSLVLPSANVRKILLFAYLAVVATGILKDNSTYIVVRLLVIITVLAKIVLVILVVILTL